MSGHRTTLSGPRRRVVLAVVAVLLLALIVLLLWRWLPAAAALGLLARALWRRHRPARRRPRASWAKNVEAVALLVAAWNTRGLVPPRRRGFALPGMLRRRAAASRARVDGPGSEIPF